MWFLTIQHPSILNPWCGKTVCRSIWPVTPNKKYIRWKLTDLAMPAGNEIDNRTLALLEKWYVIYNAPRFTKIKFSKTDLDSYLVDSQKTTSWNFPHFLITQHQPFLHSTPRIPPSAIHHYLPAPPTPKPQRPQQQKRGIYTIAAVVDIKFSA